MKVGSQSLTFCHSTPCLAELGFSCQADSVDPHQMALEELIRILTVRHSVCDLHCVI